MYRCPICRKMVSGSARSEHQGMHGRAQWRQKANRRYKMLRRRRESLDSKTLAHMRSVADREPVGVGTEIRPLPQPSLWERVKMFLSNLWKQITGE